MQESLALSSLYRWILASRSLCKDPVTQRNWIQNKSNCWFSCTVTENSIWNFISLLVLPREQSKSEIIRCFCGWFLHTWGLYVSLWMAHLLSLGCLAMSVLTQAWLHVFMGAHILIPSATFLCQRYFTQYSKNSLFQFGSTREDLSYVRHTQIELRGESTFNKWWVRALSCCIHIVSSQPRALLSKIWSIHCFSACFCSVI